MNWIFALIAFVLGSLGALHAAAQGSASDYERAFGLREKFAGKVRRDRVEPRWLSNDLFWYASNLGDGRREHVIVDAVQGVRRIALDHAAVAEALRAEGAGDFDSGRLPINAILPRDGDAIAFRIEERWWEWKDAALAPLEPAPAYEEVQPKERSAREAESRRPNDESPNGRWRVTRELGAAYLIDINSGERRLLAPAPPRDGRFETALWSPDSKHLVLPERIPGDGRIVHLIESSPTNGLQPVLHEQQYDKPGDAVPWSKPRLFSVETAAETPIDDALWPRPWSIDRVRWRPDSGSFSFVYNQRGHQLLRVIEVDASTGDARALIEEAPDTFVHYSGRGKCWLHRLEGGEEALWTSERDGWNHLFLIDTRDGRVKQQITRGPWVVRGIDHVDLELRQIWFRAGGLFANQDPYYVHHCRVEFDGENFTVLTLGDGDHRVQWSPDGRWLIDTYSRVDLAPVTTLRNAADGSLVCELERGDTTALVDAGWRVPERFVAKGRDGTTDIYGIVCRPTNFAPSKQYPVVEEHYAGPHSAHCPKRFAALHRSQEMAELGFIVIQLDGMGTDHRGKAFHDVCWQNLADGGFPDRIAWLRALAEHEPAIDLERVGIRGTSAGGQTGMAAMLNHGDFYGACVSNCGCHDNRTDKVWWNEQWMGWPIGPHYAEQSNVTNAHKLRGDLLLIVGEMDRNVPPTATLQVVDALIRADKDFEFLFVPGAGHGARHPTAGDYTWRRTWDFFVRKLHGVEPRRPEGG